jgi:hypothetical protein
MTTNVFSFVINKDPRRRSWISIVETMAIIILVGKVLLFLGIRTMLSSRVISDKFGGEVTTRRRVFVYMFLLESLAHCLVPLHHILVRGFREGVARDNFWESATAWIGDVPATEGGLQVLRMLIRAQQEVDDLPPNKAHG